MDEKEGAHLLKESELGVRMEKENDTVYTLVPRTCSRIVRSANICRPPTARRASFLAPELSRKKNPSAV